MFLDFRVKIYNFFKRNKVKIFIAIIIIAIIVGINIYLGKKQANQPPSTSYEPHTPIISGSEVKSEKTKATIDETIKNYMDKCNTKKYEDAYNMISSECKKAKFNNNIEVFKKYIDYIFDGDNLVGAIRVVDKKDGSRKRVAPVFIMKEFRNKGLAQKAFEEVEKIHGHDNWKLDTILQEEGNCYLYEKLGYKRIGLVENINDKMDIVYYEKN